MMKILRTMSSSGKVRGCTRASGRARPDRASSKDVLIFNAAAVQTRTASVRKQP